MRVENGKIVLETMTAEEWVAAGEALAPEKLERFFKENKIMGVTKNKGNQVKKSKARLTAAEIEDQEFLIGEAYSAPVAVVQKRVPVPTHLHNMAAKKRLSNLRRLKGVFNGTLTRGSKKPDGWKGDNYSAPVKRKSKDEEVAEKPAVAKAVNKMKVRG